MLALLPPITKENKKSGFPSITLEDPYFFITHNGLEFVCILYVRIL